MTLSRNYLKRDTLLTYSRYAMVNIMLFIAGFMISCSAKASLISAEKQTSIFDIVRQEMSKKTEPNIPVQTSKTIQPDKPAEPSKSIELAKSEEHAKIQQDETQTGERILHFPKSRSLGRLGIGDEKSVPDIPYPFEEVQWENFGNAQGDVKIPQGKIVQLILNSWTWQNPANLSVLKQLKTDDIYSLTLSSNWSSGNQDPSDKCLPYVLHLSGLRTLNLEGANISAKGLESLAGLNSLRRLCVPANLDDSGIAAVGTLKTLTLLRMGEDNSVTNTGLMQLENLKSLRTLLIKSVRISDEGLKVLSGLSSLNYLVLRGNFTDEAALYLKDVSSLKGLKIDPGQFGDLGMKNVAGLTQLENLDVHWIKDITDEGISYLKNIPNLKKSDLDQANLTDKAMLDIKHIKSLENLYLPPVGLTDEGLKNINELKNLKYLSINGSGLQLTDESLRYISQLKNLESLHIGGSAFSDEGMKYIAQLAHLKSLAIFYASQLTNKGLAELAHLESLTSLTIGRNTKVSISGLKTLNTLKNLRRLDIEDIHQDNSEIMDISGLTGLKDIRLFLHYTYNEDRTAKCDSPFRDEDWTCLARLTNLKTLAITGVGITDNGIKYLSDLKNLEYLNIICRGELSITDESLKYLNGMDKLYKLQITDGHFTDKALEYLSGMTALNWLELTSDFAFSTKAIKNLQTKNPNIGHLQLIP